jgi:hypothetical protein
MTAQAQGATSQVSDNSSRASSAQSAWRPLTPALAKQLSRHVSHKVIVVLRNQLTGLPDTPANSARRGTEVAALQKGVVADLAATGSRNIKSISLVNAIAATVSAGEAKRLATNPAVARVIADLPIPVASSAPFKPTTSAAPAAGIKPLPGACPTGKKAVQLNPEAIETIHAATQSGKGDSAQALGYTGAGVKVAWIADGLDVNNPDFIRANGKHVFVDYQDFSGTGTNAPTDGGEAFLDASSIAAQGREVYNVAGYGFGLSVPCRIRILGVAPGASLVGLNVFGSADVAFNSVFLEAINYAVGHDHVNVINESFGSNPFPDSQSLDLTVAADNAAIKAGVTVTVSSGDAGVTNTIGSPATDPLVISAGASTTYRGYAQTGIAGITTPGVKGWLDNNISGLSSGGFDQAGGTVDVVAPGDLNWALCTPKPALYAACTNFSDKPAAVELEGGTSEASPLTAGVAALVIQAYAESHHGKHPTPAVVKKIIVSTAQDISAPAQEQGAGLIDAYAAVLAARSYQGGSQSKQGHAVLESSTQFHAAGQTGTTEVFNETLTNDGAGPVTEHVSSRTLEFASTLVNKTITLDKSKGFTTELKFNVPAGDNRLNVSVALKGVVNLSLISPKGEFAEYNLPQGIGNDGDAQVANPTPGTWIALINAEPTSNVSSVKAAVLAAGSKFHSFGILTTNSVTLAPGASKSVTLTVNTPAAPGDESGAIVLHSTAKEPGFAMVNTVPVTLRSYVPSSGAEFEAGLSGGNGRAGNTGQTLYYQMDVTSPMPALYAQVFTQSKGNTVFAELVDPAGEAVSAANSSLLGTNASGKTVLNPQIGTQVHALNPTPGIWTLVINFYNTISGTSALAPVAIEMDSTQVPVSAPGLPDNSSVQLARGTASTFNVTVTNASGFVPEEYFIDARNGGHVTLKLAAQTTSDLKLPNLAGIVPTYLVPSLTTKLSAQVSAKAANFFDLSYPFGDPDLISSIGKTSSLNFSAPDIADGDWTVTPFLKGPDGAHGAKAVTSHISLSAVTAPIDRSVSSPTGDLWADSTNANAGFAPFVVQPGQSVTIPVTIDPTGAAGTVISGTLYVSTVSFSPGLITSNDLTGNFPTASNVAAIPYTYTIGS